MYRGELGMLSVTRRRGGSNVDLVFMEGRSLAESSGDLPSFAILLNVYGKVICARTMSAPCKR